MNTRNEIIDAIVAAYRAEVEQNRPSECINVDDGNVVVQDVREYEDIIRTTLTEKLASLGPDERVRTCEDFGHYGIACCESCHESHPHYELNLIELESGGRALICCKLDRILNPVRHRRLLDSPEYREIEKFFASDGNTKSPMEDK